MNRLLRAAGIALVLLARPTAAAPPASAPPTAEDASLPMAPLHEQVLLLPGDPDRPVSLQVTLFTPSGAGPFPLAVMNHGATDASAGNRGQRYHHTLAAYYFLSRGYAVALPMMRGFAGSGGSLYTLGCSFENVADHNGRDIAAVIAALVRRPEIDGRRIVVAGQSFGGWNTLGVGIAPPPGVRGLVLFNAAFRTSACRAVDANMAVAAGLLGGQTNLPSLWFYGDNDTLMPQQTWQSVFRHFAGTQSRAELVNIGKFRDDSHQFLSYPDSLPLWAPRLDAFLARLGLPAQETVPGYLPQRPPPASQFAALTNVTAVPFISDAGRAAYQKFLLAKPPRAFVIAPNGAVSFVGGGYDPIGTALRNCAHATTDCRLYAFNDDIVWTPPGQVAPQARTVARKVAMNVATALGTFFQVNPDCSSRGLSKLIVLAPPGHGSVDIHPQDAHPNFPAGSPFAVCNAGMVPGIGIDYTPAHGFQGADSLMFEEVSPTGRRQTVRLNLSVG